MSEVDSIRLEQEFRALLECAKVMRDSAERRENRYQHIVTQSQWSAFCKQIKIAEHALNGGDKWNRPRL